MRKEKPAGSKVIQAKTSLSEKDRKSGERLEEKLNNVRVEEKRVPKELKAPGGAGAFRGKVRPENALDSLMKRNNL